MITLLVDLDPAGSSKEGTKGKQDVTALHPHLTGLGDKGLLGKVLWGTAFKLKYLDKTGEGVTKRKRKKDG